MENENNFILTTMRSPVMKTNDVRAYIQAFEDLVRTVHRFETCKKTHEDGQRYVRENREVAMEETFASKCCDPAFKRIHLNRAHHINAFMDAFHERESEIIMCMLVSSTAISSVSAKVDWHMRECDLEVLAHLHRSELDRLAGLNDARNKIRSVLHRQYLNAILQMIADSEQRLAKL